MTEKQWKIISEEFISYTGGNAQTISNGDCTVHLWEHPKDAQLFCDKLNASNDEKKALGQFKEKVFNLLDEKIRRYEHKPVSAPVGNPVSVKFDHDVDRLARLSELEHLKWELSE